MSDEKDNARREFVACPRPDLDVKQLRKEINERYANTLRYLARGPDPD